MIGRRQSRFRQPLYLPPPEVRLFTPGKDEPLETKLDDRGLVDVDAFIAAVKSTVDPEFRWEPSERPDAHHLYWEHNLYPNTPDASVNPEEFCNLPINQIVIPRLFHNWAHLVTKEPAIPTKEVMQHRMEAYRVVKNLFDTARLSVELTNERYIAKERFNRGSERHLWQFLIEVEEAKKIPPEFHIIDFSELNPTTPEEHRALIDFLGGAITKANRAQEVRQAA